MTVPCSPLGSPKSQQDPWEVLGPLGGREAWLQGILQLAVDPLDHAGALGVLGCGGARLDSQSLAGVCPEVGGELLALVKGEPGWDTKTGHPGVDKDVGAGLGIHDNQGDCFQPPTQPVYDGDEYRSSGTPPWM